jgi:hypothetical protein
VRDDGIAVGRARTFSWWSVPSFVHTRFCVSSRGRVACCCGEGSGVWLDMGRMAVALPAAGPGSLIPGPRGLLVAFREGQGPMSSHTALAGSGLLVVAGLGFGRRPAPEPVHQPVFVVPVDPRAGDRLYSPTVVSARALS